MYNMPWVCFHMHVGVFPSRFQGEGAWLKNHLEPMRMIEIGNRLGARLVRAACSKPADTEMDSLFLCRYRAQCIAAERCH